MVYQKNNSNKSGGFTGNNSRNQNSYGAKTGSNARNHKSHGSNNEGRFAESKSNNFNEELKIDSYVDTAEKLIKKYMNTKGTDRKVISTSQIRNILAMTSDILNKINASSQDEISDEIIQALNYLRIRTVYDSGREKSVKEFVEYTHILVHLKSVMESKKRADVELFCHYVESLVAFFKFNGGKDLTSL